LLEILVQPFAVWTWCVCVCVCFRGDLCRKEGEGRMAYLHWQLYKGKWADFKAPAERNCKSSVHSLAGRLTVIGCTVHRAGQKCVNLWKTILSWC